MSNPIVRRAALLLGCVVNPVPAHAHLVSSRFGDFYAGLLHPVTAFENMLPWLALGLLAGLQGGRPVRWLLVVFPLAAFIGALLAPLVPGIAGLAPFNLASFVALGALVALARPLAPALLLGLGALFGLSHGYDNGLALSKGGSIVLFASGVMTAGYLTIVLTTATTLAIASERAWARIAVRAVGSWIAALGIMMLGLGAMAR